MSSQAIYMNFAFSGDVWLKHGKILNLSITCDGSGPWDHCWFLEQNYTVFGNETCDGRRTRIISKGKCSFNVTQYYFAKNGEYSIVVIVDDGLVHKVKQIGVNVYKGPR